VRLHTPSHARLSPGSAGDPHSHPGPYHESNLRHPRWGSSATTAFPPCYHLIKQTLVRSDFCNRKAAHGSRQLSPNSLRFLPFPLVLDYLSAVGVAQLVERRTVAPNVVGSNPISHPNFSITYINWARWKRATWENLG
jgi:hypothetical protein